MMPAMNTAAVSAAPDAVLVRARTVALASLVGLIVLGLAWELWLAPTGARTWAIKVLPLAFAVAGIARFRMFTHRWVSLLVWLYVTEGLVRGVTERGLSMTLAWLQVLLCLVLFAACSTHVRWRLRKS
jgi:uncharacterized membrane protein